jgi:hypothetical protein
LLIFAINAKDETYSFFGAFETTVLTIVVLSGELCGITVEISVSNEQALISFSDGTISEVSSGLVHSVFGIGIVIKRDLVVFITSAIANSGAEIVILQTK